MLIEKCGECGKYRNGCDGIELTYPAVPAGLHVNIEINCPLFAQKTSAVDPTLTQESVCGECEHDLDGPCETGYNTEPDNVACAKFKAKEPTPARLKAKDCQFYEFEVGEASAQCVIYGNSGQCPIRGNDAACKHAKPRETTP